ncbi:MAG: hypothetical protein ACPGUV_08820 [Polyangiales bacterium]
MILLSLLFGATCITACGYVHLDRVPVLAAGQCLNGQQDSGESDIDCGGACSACSLGAACTTSEDCHSQLCAGGRCVAEVADSCSNGVIDADESDVDCGGRCLACALGAQCQAHNDCSSAACVAAQCAAALPVSCSDGIQNGDESGPDCGGSCALCTSGAGCTGGDDCESGVCSGSVCQAPSCTDFVTYGDETDDDCGGDICGPCENGDSCITGTDCNSLVCSGGICQAPSCSDGIQNGSETGVDCGGTCGSCGGGEGGGG